MFRDVFFWKLASEVISLEIKLQKKIIFILHNWYYFFLHYFQRFIEDTLAYYSLEPKFQFFACEGGNEGEWDCWVLLTKGGASS